MQGALGRTALALCLCHQQILCVAVCASLTAIGRADA